VSAIDHGDPLLGTTLLERYLILERIGAGAMGAVYRAEQVGLRRKVALKVLKKQVGSSTDVVARFEREATAMSALTHPNTVRVYDFGSTDQGLLFLAMELLEGELASHRLGQGGAARPSEAITWAQQVLRSIGEAHAKGIIHRDIKPDNIYLARVPGRAEPVVKVLDFGIAKSVSGEQKLSQFETLDGTVFGTPRYMSPEQAQGKPLDARSDLYAVGIVLYELLVGEPPFVDKDAVVVMAKHIREEPIPLARAALGRTFSTSLQRVLDRALAKSPEHRFQSCEQFERALDRCLRDAELLERTPERGQKLLASALGAPRWAHWAVGSTFAMLLAATATAIVAAGQIEPPAHAKVAAPVAAAAPAQRTAPQPMLTLYSEPRRANVWRHGRFLGVTPLPLEVPHGRTLRVQVSLPGFESETLDLSAGERSRLVKLERARSQTQALTRDERPRTKRKLQREPARTAKPGDAYEKF